MSTKDLVSIMREVQNLGSTPASLILGFDDFFRDFDEMIGRSRSSSSLLNGGNFPPFNIKRRDSEYILELALAGFKRKDIKIDLNSQKNILSISGESEKDGHVVEQNCIEDESASLKKDSISESNWKFLHKGIAKRKFKQEFKIPRGSEISSAKMIDGMLIVKIHLPNLKDNEVISIDIE